uniref:NAC transcription factor n=1 Tax=Solanum tuberosum TaxID=4113 RepID=M1DKR3_SOLTU
MEFEEEGFRFRPENSELLTYLLRFIAEKDLHDDGFITECDVYKQEPWRTYSRGCHCGGGDDGDTSIFRYFISPRHKKKKTNDRFCRVVGKNLGTWKQQDKGKMVVSKHNKSLSMGLKKSLYYDTKMCCPDDGKWLMKEYVFCEAILRKFENSNFKDYCICAIKTKPEKNSASCSRSSNMSTTDEQKVDTKVISGVNSVVPRMDQECKEVTPINIVEPMVQIQEASSGEEKIKELIENDDPEITLMRNEDYGMINHPINVVENPAMEVDDVEVQIQEAAGEWNGVLEFENTMPENNLPKQPAHLQQDCPFGFNEDRIASFVGLPSGCGNSAIRNNQVQIQEAPGEENGQLELNTFSQIQQPMIPDFANVKSNITIPEIYDTLAEYMGVDVLMNPNNELLIHPFDFSKHQVQITQEAAGEENGLLGKNMSPFSKVQEFVMPENNVPEMFDTGDTLLEINQTPQEESETLCETEESSFVADLTEALLDHEPLKDRWDAIRESKSTLLLDQQSWQSKAHLQDMLL